MNLTLVRPFGLPRKRKWRNSSHVEKKDLPMKHKKIGNRKARRIGKQRKDMEKSIHVITL